jgi:hypothetical protein
MELYRTHLDYGWSLGHMGRYQDEPPYDQTRDELIANLVEPTIKLQDDTEDFIRAWLLSNPEIGDVLHENLNDLPIERIH